MTRCKTLKERTLCTVSALLAGAVVVVPMTITTLAGVRCFDAQQYGCNIVGYVEAIPSPFARPPSTRYPLLPSAHESASPSVPAIRVLRRAPCQRQPDCPFSLTHLIMRRMVWLCVARMPMRERTAQEAFWAVYRGNLIGTDRSRATHVRP